MKKLAGLVAAALLVLSAAPAPAKPKAAAKKPVRAARAAITRPAPLPPLPTKTKNSAPRGETVEEQVLQDELDRLLSDRPLARAVNGVYVVDRRTGAVLYAYNADRQLNPASNVKLVSTGAALDALGANFSFRTRLLGPQPDADGVIHGDVYLVGMMDPTLRPAHLGELAGVLADRGVTAITGDVVVGMDDVRDAPARATVAVTVEGVDEEGAAAEVVTDPDSAYVVVKGKVTTTDKIKRARVDVSVRTIPGAKGKAEQVEVDVAGKVRPGQRVTVERALPHPALFAGHTLRGFLVRKGVRVDGGVRRAAAPPALDSGQADELAVHEGVAFAALAALVNKPSSNFLADRMIATAGGEIVGGEPSVKKGVEVMAAFLDRIGIEPGSYFLENGSGLSHASHMSARQIVRVLEAAGGNPRSGRDFVASLSIGGRDGTLRGRFAGHAEAGLVFGKTGTLNGVAALSGFVEIAPDRLDDGLVFAILTNGFGDGYKPQIRAAQVKLVDAMYAFLVRRDGGSVPPASPMVAEPGAAGTTPPSTVDGDDTADAPTPPVGDPAAVVPESPRTTGPASIKEDDEAPPEEREPLPPVDSPTDDFAVPPRPGRGEPLPPPEY